MQLKTTLTLIAVIAITTGPAPVRAGDPAIWSAYLDQAYVYSSASRDEIQSRIKTYGREAGISLADYIEAHLDVRDILGFDNRGENLRRTAVAHLLLYLSTEDVASLKRSVKLAKQLGAAGNDLENRYWNHYINAQAALAHSDSRAFADHAFALWLRVVVPMEAGFGEIDSLSLETEERTGFISALPHVYENLSRLILLRSQEVKLDSDVDVLGALVTLLDQDRAGAHPSVVPLEASSKALLSGTRNELAGPRSDGGSLTFVLELTDARKKHHAAREIYAAEGLGPRALAKLESAGNAYRRVLDQADTLQGQAVAYTQGLRLATEIVSLGQKHDVPIDLDFSLTLRGARDVYAEMHELLDGDFSRLGFQASERSAYIEALHSLYAEIQEASLARADYLLSQSRSMERPIVGVRNAARSFGQQLLFFEKYATDKGREAIPTHAYFGAFEALRGFANAYLSYSARPTTAEVDLARKHYIVGLTLFPFDRQEWGFLMDGLRRHSLEGNYSSYVSPVAKSVRRSSSVEDWVSGQGPAFEQVQAIRKALGDELALTYMGFSSSLTFKERVQGLEDLRGKKVELETTLASLFEKRDELSPRTPGIPASIDPSIPVEAEDEGEGKDELSNVPALRGVVSEIDLTQRAVRRVENQIAARSRALPLFQAALSSDGLSDRLRSDRSHPLHELLERMYFENGAVLQGFGDE